MCADSRSSQLESRYFEEDRYIPVVISSQDTDVVRSPEALTLLQLMQGIDMGTPLLPPDALQRAYDEPGSALRPRDPKTGQRAYEPESVALTEVRIYPPRPGANFGRDSELAPGRALDISSEQMALRDSVIRARAPDLVKALRTLNVIIDSDRAVDLLRAYSSEKGDLDRAAFSDTLAAARVPVSRSPKSPWARSPPTFSLVAVTSESVGQEADVSAFVGLSLHLRHRVPIVVKGGRRAPGDTKVSLQRPGFLSQRYTDNGEHTRRRADVPRQAPELRMLCRMWRRMPHHGTGTRLKRRMSALCTQVGAVLTKSPRRAQKW